MLKFQKMQSKNSILNLINRSVGSTSSELVLQDGQLKSMSSPFQSTQVLQDQFNTERNLSQQNLVQEILLSDPSVLKLKNNYNESQPLLNVQDEKAKTESTVFWDPETRSFKESKGPENALREQISQHNLQVSPRNCDAVPKEKIARQGFGFNEPRVNIRNRYNRGLSTKTMTSPVPSLQVDKVCDPLHDQSLQNFIHEHSVRKMKDSIDQLLTDRQILQGGKLLQPLTSKGTSAKRSMLTLPALPETLRLHISEKAEKLKSQGKGFKEAAWVNEDVQELEMNQEISAEQQAKDEERRKILESAQRKEKMRKQEEAKDELKKMLEADVKKAIDDKVQRVHNILDAPVKEEKQSFVALAQAYKRKMDDTGEAIVQIIKDENDEIAKSLKIIDFMKRLQAADRPLGDMSYNEIKDKYEQIEVKKKLAAQLAVKEEAKKRLGELRKQLDDQAQASESQSNKQSMFGIMQKMNSAKKLDGQLDSSLQALSPDLASVEGLLKQHSKDSDEKLGVRRQSLAPGLEENSKTTDLATVVDQNSNSRDNMKVIELSVVSGQISARESVDTADMDPRARAMHRLGKQEEQQKILRQTEQSFQLNRGNVNGLKPTSTDFSNKGDSQRPSELQHRTEETQMRITESQGSFRTDSSMRSSFQTKKRVVDIQNDYKVYNGQGKQKPQKINALIEQKKLHSVLRQFDYQVGTQTDNAFESYDIDEPEIKEFTQACQLHEINPFPILHQVYQGILLLIGRSYEVGTYCKLLDLIIDLAIMLPECIQPLHTVFFSNNEIEDEEMAKFIQMLGKVQSLREINFANQKIGSHTHVALSHFQGDKTYMCPKFLIQFRNCSWENTRIDHHPIFSTSLNTVLHLQLSDVWLQDDLFDKIYSRTLMLESLDLSFNRFTSEKLFAYLKKIASQNQVLSLRSLVLTGNKLIIDLKDQEELNNTLESLLQSKYLQHVDFSLMGLTLVNMQTLIRALTTSPSMTALHLSYPCIADLRRIAAHELRDAPRQELIDNKVPKQEAHKAHRFIDAMRPKELEPALDLAWNDRKECPSRDLIDLTKQITSAVSNEKARVDMVEKGLQPNNPLEVVKPVQKTFWEQSYVLSRLIGRPELDYYSSRTHNCGENKLESLLNKTKIDKTCWVESHECWICERWNYFIPTITRDEIEESFPGSTQTTHTLNPKQEKGLEKMISLNQEEYDYMDWKRPYIVGSITDFKLKPMDEFVSYLQEIDPESNLVQQEAYNDQDRVKEYYMHNWKQLLFNKHAKAASKNPPDFKKGTIRRKKSINDGVSVLEPYEPQFERSMKPKSLDEGHFREIDVVWSYSTLARPGKHIYYILYKFDDERVFKMINKTSVCMRSFPIHTHQLQLQKNTGKDQKKKRVYYFNVFKKWTGDTYELQQQVFEQDNKNWPQPGKKIFGIKTNEEISQIKEAMKLYLPKLIPLFRYLSYSSESFPLIDYKVMYKFIRDLKLFDDRFPKHTFSNEFTQLKTYEYRRENGKILPVLANQKVRGMIGTNDSNSPSNELSRANFFELLVRISIHKFIKTKKKIGLRQEIPFTPLMCFQKLIEDFILSQITKKNIMELQTFRERQVFNNNDNLRKFLFLNQFSLRQVFNELMKQQKNSAYSEQDFTKVQKETSPSIAQKGSLSPLKERSQSNDKSPTNVKKVSLNAVKNTSNDSKHQASTDKMKESQALMNATLSTIKSVQHSVDSTETEAKKKVSPLKKLLNMANLKKAVKNADTNVKAMKAPKGLHSEFLLTKIHLLLPEHSKVINKKLFQKCFSMAKMTIPGYGTTLHHFKMDVDRASRLTYIEFLVFLCLLARCIFSPQTESASVVTNFAFNQDFQVMIKMIFENMDQKLELEEVPDDAEDMNGVFVPPSEFRHDGRTIIYKPQTPAQSVQEHMFETHTNYNHY